MTLTLIDSQTDGIIDTNQDLSRTIIQLSSGRSGSTLLSNVINWDGCQRILFEPMYYEVPELLPYSQEYFDPDGLHPQMLLAFTSHLSGSLHYPYINKLTPPGRYEDRIFKEVRANMLASWLMNFFPACKMIFLVRHPFAVCASKMAMKFYVNATHRPHIEEAFPFIRSIAASIKEEDEWASYVFDWCVENYIPLKQLQGRNYHLVFFEDLRLEPEFTIAKLFGFLNRCYDEDKVLEVLQTPSQTAALNPNYSETDQPHLPSYWQRQLTTQQIAQGMDILARFGLDKLYDTDGVPNPDFEHSLV